MLRRSSSTTTTTEPEQAIEPTEEPTDPVDDRIDLLEAELVRLRRQTRGGMDEWEQRVEDQAKARAEMTADRHRQTRRGAEMHRQIQVRRAEGAVARAERELEAAQTRLAELKGETV